MNTVFVNDGHEAVYVEGKRDRVRMTISQPWGSEVISMTAEEAREVLVALEEAIKLAEGDE